MPGAFKLDHLQPFKPILFRNFSNFFTFMLGSPFLLPQRVNNGTISHPRPRDTGKYAAQGPNIMSPEGPMMLPEGRRAELEARGQHHGARGRHNVARGRHIFQWPEAMGVILTLSYRQGVILAVLKSNMQRCDIDSTEIQYSP